MKKIDRKYAKIYIYRLDEIPLDDEGDINWDGLEMVNDYYKDAGGAIRWNFYLIIEKQKGMKKEDIEKIESDGTYSRKYVIDKENIDEFIEKRFPELKEKHGNITLLTGKSWVEVCDLATIKQKELSANLMPSFNRNINEMDTLEAMDLLRALLINHDDVNYIFYTHIGKEYSLAKMKFDFFMEKK